MLLIPIPKTAVNTSEKLEKDTMPLGRCWSSAHLELSASSAAAFSLSPSPSLLPQLLCLPTGSSQQALLASTTLPTPLGSNLPICQTWCEFRLGLPSAFFCSAKKQQIQQTSSHHTYGIPATSKQTEQKHMAFQPPPYRNKTHGFPATTQQKQKTWLSSRRPIQKQNTWLSSHQPAETKYIGIPATSKQTETKHMAFQPLLPEIQAFSFQKRYG